MPASPYNISRQQPRQTFKLSPGKLLQGYTGL